MIHSPKQQLKKAKLETQLHLKNKFIQRLLLLSGFRFATEYQFSLRKWKIDYALPALKIALEVEGGVYKKSSYIDKETGNLTVFKGGRHNSSIGFIKDMEKYNALAASGWLLIRTTPDLLFSEDNISTILKCIEIRTQENNAKKKIIEEINNCWVAVTDALPKALQTVWLTNGKGWCCLGCLVEDNEGWHWSESNGVIYIENGEIVSECESEDLDVNFWHPLPKPPCC